MNTFIIISLDQSERSFDWYLGHHLQFLQIYRRYHLPIEVEFYTIICCELILKKAHIFNDKK